MFETQLLTCISACTTEVVNGEGLYKKLKPWINYNICRRIKKRNELYSKIKSRPINDNFRQYFVRFRNKLKKDINYAKISYYSKKFTLCSGNSKQIWNTVNEISGQKNCSQNFSLNINGAIIKESKTVANEFNKYFLTVVREIVEDHSISDNFSQLAYKNTFPDHHEQNSILLGPVLNEDVEKVIKSLKHGKSPGSDGISSTIIKHIYPAIVDVIAYLINLSFETGVFPDKLKNAVVVPIHKKGPANLFSNFRPISLLSTLSKLFEKIMKERMISFLDRNKYFSKNQYGFREGLSTELALLNFMGQVNRGINDGHNVSGLFIDIKKAFDTVDHGILLKKLYNCGFRGTAHDWFNSYLSNRKQCVRINDTVSEMGEITCGVPQGSVLGAILFIIFVNDLCNGNYKGKLTAFADDTALCYVEKDPNTLSMQIQSDLGSLNWWFITNKLVLNVDKTTYLNFSLRKNTVFQENIIFKCSCCLGSRGFCNKCSVIKGSSNIKYLGVILDSELNWKIQIQNLRNKIVTTIRLFYFLKDICSLAILRSLYFALVNSRLEYGIVCWGGTYMTNLKSLVTAQKLFVRLILKRNRYDPSLPCFIHLKILPLRSLFVYKTLKIFHRSRNLNQENLHRARLRNSKNSFVPKPNLTYYTKTFNFLAPKFFNQLENVIKMETNHRRFLKKVREWLMSLENIELIINVTS